MNIRIPKLFIGTLICLWPFGLTFWQWLGISVIAGMFGELLIDINSNLEAIKKSTEDVDTKIQEIDIELENDSECCGGTGGEKCHCKNSNQLNKDGKN